MVMLIPFNTSGESGEYRNLRSDTSIMQASPQKSLLETGREVVSERVGSLIHDHSFNSVQTPDELHPLLPTEYKDKGRKCISRCCIRRNNRYTNDAMHGISRCRVNDMMIPDAVLNKVSLIISRSGDAAGSHHELAEKLSLLPGVADENLGNSGIKHASPVPVHTEIATDINDESLVAAA